MPGNVAQLRTHIVKLCRALSEEMCRKVVTNARVRLQEVVRQKTVVTLNMFFIRNKQLRAHIVKLCRALSEELCRKVVTNARVRLQEVVGQKRWSH